ncbi:hypothetical protein ABND49_07865 [Paenibacillus larvae]|uniref:Uncharacterized protein n=1 Tax=Paenibacillus larvae TaxID=1464 RepID=A0AAP5JQK4_9BACL|nr:hypothetical protein [Paenibacillus larvae]MDT2250190.1 hypothetical protein [Paenibacillus larvae]MDV3486452.1 hypothetical protein [Paenibacillus larvae]
MSVFQLVAAVYKAGELTRETNFTQKLSVQAGGVYPSASAQNP